MTQEDGVDGQTAWGNLRAEFRRLVGEYGLDHEVWADMTGVADVAGGGSRTTTESVRLFESFRAKFEGQGCDAKTAERMARDAARGRSVRLFG